MNIKLIPIFKDIKENEFPDHIKKEGYSCLKFNNKNLKKIEKILNIKEMDYFYIGSPDFFIWKDKKYYLCEFKSKNDSLSNNQLSWFFRFKKYPKAIAFVSIKLKKYYDELEKEKQIRGILKKQERIYKKIQEKIEKKKNKENIKRWERYDEIIKDYTKKRIHTGMIKYKVNKNKFIWIGIPCKKLRTILRKEGFI